MGEDRYFRAAIRHENIKRPPLDERDFTRIVLPDKAYKQRVIFQHICDVIISKGQVEYYKDIINPLEAQGENPKTINNVWTAMFGSGMLDREKRNEPTSFSYDFGRILIRLAMSWFRFLYVKGYIDEKEFDRVIKREFKWLLKSVKQE